MLHTENLKEKKENLFTPKHLLTIPYQKKYINHVLSIHMNMYTCTWTRSVVCPCCIDTNTKRHKYADMQNHTNLGYGYVMDTSIK